jgi:anti-sigma-K factor RskA
LFCAPAEFSCRAERRALWKPSNSSTVRFSRRDRIWSSVRTVRVIVAVVVEINVIDVFFYEVKTV